MGLLDDAIREHLELKRRRGANAAELARQEHEAFGPPRRGDFDVAPAESNGAEAEVEAEEHPEPVAFEPAQPTALHAVEDEGAHELPIGAHEDEPHVQDEPPRPHGDPADALLAHHDEPTGQPTRAFDAEEVRAATQPEPAPEVDDEPEPPPPPRAVEPEPEPPTAAEPAAPAPPEPPVSEPEPAAPAAARPDEEAEGEDVLEETPEFLQETPEHDRLWFEQRPPRDFDF